MLDSNRIGLPLAEIEVSPVLEGGIFFIGPVGSVNCLTPIAKGLEYRTWVTSPAAGGQVTVSLGRREFIVLAGAAATTLPFAARSQQRVRTIGVLLGLAKDDKDVQARIKAFEQGLERLGWSIGRDLRIEYRFAASDLEQMRTLGKELVELQPDVILGHSTAVVTALMRETQKVPIVFVVVSYPIGSGFVKSMNQPGGIATGFTNHVSTITGKFLELLKEIAPQVARVSLMYNPDSATFAESYYQRPFQAAASSFGVEPGTALVRSTAEIEHAMAALACQPGGGLIVIPDNFTSFHRKLIISLAARYRLPAAYPYRYFCDDGGLLAYGVDLIDLFRRAAAYVDRILKGKNPADLPVQAPMKFELVINMKTAKALGLTVPPILLMAANSVIE
jgi:putative ABC transport system substrate-binding protein